MANEELSQLRAQVADYDRRILELIAQRLETTRQIGEIKQREGLPIRDFRVEVDVLRRVFTSLGGTGAWEAGSRASSSRRVTGSV